MKRQVILLSILFALFGWSNCLHAQKLVLEKTYEIDKKAKKGYLNSVTTNTGDKTTTLSFVTKSNSKKVMYQNYIFDKEYNFIKKEEKEDVFTNAKYKSEKGEKYVVDGVTLEQGFSLNIKKRRIEYSWSWINFRYEKKITLLDKVKLKDEEGNKYWLVKQFENDQTGDIYAMVIASGKTATPNEYTLIKIGQDLKVEITDKISFKKQKGFRGSFYIPVENPNETNDDDGETENDMSNSDLCFIFAAEFTPDKDRLGENTDFEMIRVSKEGKVIKRIEFKVKSSEWNIINVTANAGSLYFIGPANEGKPLGASKVSVSFGENTKYNFYQIAKITGDNVDYVTSTKLDEFEAKLKKPASQKKSPEYKGKKFTIRNISVAKDGAVFIYGQNFSGEKWDDILMFYFDKTGVLKAQYGVRLEERNDFSEKRMARQFIKLTDANAYWEIWELEDIDDGRALQYPNISKINLATGDISDFQKFGTVKDKPTYYLQNSYPCIINPEDNSLIYLGQNKKSNILWFGKIVVE